MRIEVPAVVDPRWFGQTIGERAAGEYAAQLRAAQWEALMRLADRFGTDDWLQLCAVHRCHWIRVHGEIRYDWNPATTPIGPDDAVYFVIEADRVTTPETS